MNTETIDDCAPPDFLITINRAKCGSRRRFLAGMVALVAGTIPGFSVLARAATRQSRTASAGRLHCLSLRVLLQQAAAGVNTKNVLWLDKINRIEGFIFDAKARDVILVGYKSSDYPLLHLDDLAVTVANIWGHHPDPYCSLDPREEDIRAVDKLMEQGNQTVHLPEQARELFRRLKKVWGPQRVVVGGVPQDSRVAHAMVFGDGEMKKATQGLTTLPDIRNLLDIMLDESEAAVRAGQPIRLAGPSMARYWFHVAKNQPTFLTDDGIVMLEHCSVVVLTMPQGATPDGQLVDMEVDDPHAKAVAEALSRAFPQLAKMVPEFGALDNYYRLIAVLRALHFDSALERIGVDLSPWALGYRLQETKPMPATYPGLANTKEKVIKIQQGNRISQLFLLPMVCGGVDMNIEINRAALAKAPGGQLSVAQREIVRQRPDYGTLSWSLV